MSYLLGQRTIRGSTVLRQSLLRRRTARGSSIFGAFTASLRRLAFAMFPPFMKLIPRPSRHAEFAPLFMRDVSRLMGLNHPLNWNSGRADHFWSRLLSLRLLQDDHLFFRFARMTQAVVDLQWSNRQVIAAASTAATDPMGIGPFSSFIG